MYIVLKWKLMRNKKWKIEDPASKLSSASWENFLSLTNKHDFTSEHFSNQLICWQRPKQLETWDGSLA